MLYEEERELRTAMHEAREKSGVSKYINKRDAGLVAEEIIDERTDAVYGKRSLISKKKFLDENVGLNSYADLRDWVEDVVDGFNKGMQFDSVVDKKNNVNRAVSMFLKPTKGYMVYLNNNAKSRKMFNAMSQRYATR